MQPNETAPAGLPAARVAGNDPTVREFGDALSRLTTAVMYTEYEGLKVDKARLENEYGNLEQLRRDVDAAYLKLLRRIGEPLAHMAPTPRPGGHGRDPRDCDRIAELETEVARLRGAVAAGEAAVTAWERMEAHPTAEVYRETRGIWRVRYLDAAGEVRITPAPGCLTPMIAALQLPDSATTEATHAR